jgi:hypothetical protein
LTGVAALPLLFRFRRALDLALADVFAALRGEDFFCDDLLLAARDFGFFLAIDALPARANNES